MESRLRKESERGDREEGWRLVRSFIGNVEDYS